MEAKATARTVLIAPRKARLVIDLVRGKSVSEAMTILNNMNRKAARLTKKVLVSATANAENNFNMNMDEFFEMGMVITPKQFMEKIAVIDVEKL